MLIWRQLRIVWRSGDVGEETRCGRGNTRKQLKVKIPTLSRQNARQGWGTLGSFPSLISDIVIGSGGDRSYESGVVTFGVFALVCGLGGRLGAGCAGKGHH